MLFYLISESLPGTSCPTFIGVAPGGSSARDFRSPASIATSARTGAAPYAMDKLISRTVTSEYFRPIQT